MTAMRLLIGWFLIQYLVALGSARVEAKTVKVFILAGQSNMEGQAVVDLAGRDYNQGKGTLLNLYERPDLVESIRHLRDSNGQWVVRDDVFVSYRRENGSALSGPLSVGFSVYGDRHHFGPELQFGHVVGDAFEEPVLLIKTAWGGKSLYRDFRPPSAGGEVGLYYQKMIREIRETLARFESEFPALSGLSIELAGFVWYQGWNDGVDPKNAIPEYESNLVHLIQDVRRDLNVPDLPIIIGELTGPWVDAPPEWEKLREAQRRAARHVSLGPAVRFVPTRSFVREAHESPNPTHGHHEFGNAETYFLVGDALGRAYLDVTNSERRQDLLKLESPLDYQVLQRSSQRSALVSIRGETEEPLGDDVRFEASFELTDSTESNSPLNWKQFTMTCEATQFSGAIELPEGGWYTLRVRAIRGESIVAEAMVPHVGVGEVFVVAGQSNSANHGEERTVSKTGLVSMQSRDGWLLAQDPISGASGNGGSFLPHFGDRIAENFDVPVGIIARGIGATSVREWLPQGVRFPNPPTIESRVRRIDDSQWESDGKAYQSLRKAVESLGPSGLRAVLWHQGESDANQRDTTRTLQGDLYTKYLTTIIQGIQDDAGWHVPWFVAQASYHTPDDAGSQEIRSAQLAVAGSGVALQGPDSDTLQGDYRDQGGRGVHFSAKGLLAHGDLWFEKVSPWIEAQVNQQTTPFKVGVNCIDITPNYPVRLNGFAFRKNESEGVAQRIWARALAISHDTDEPVVIVTLDNLGIRFVDVERVAKRLGDELNLPRKNFVVTFTHTHSAPKLTGSSDNIFAEPIPVDHQQRIDLYTEFLVDSLAVVSRNAIANRVPATLHWGDGSVDFAINRRTPGGPVDHSLPVLIAKTADEESRILAIYTTYACHCVTLSQNRIDGDWAGYAVESIERLFPGAIGMVSIGCGSDQNPNSGVTGDKVDIARQQGIEVADEVARLVRAGILREITAAPTAALRITQLPFENIPDERELADIVRQGGPAGYNAQTQLEKIKRGETLPSGLQYPIQCFSFGDQLSMLFLAGEVCVDYALRIRDEFKKDRLWLHGYSNDFGAYIPSERLLKEGGYGAGAEIPYFGLPSPLKSGIEQQIIEEVSAILPRTLAIPPGTRGISARSPKASLESIQVAPEYEVQLVASEPQISDPVAIDFGIDGSLWVCQMSDYGHGVHEVFEPSGKIRVLRDSDGDGFYETSNVFLEGLRYPTDVKCWREGVLVCDAPNIIFAKDTNGDGVADIREVVCTGFSIENGQARVNSLHWGLDGWIYGSCGLFGGSVHFADQENVDIRGRDFRIRPDEKLIEPVTGRSQQGRVRNDWDDWFGCDNGTLIRHYPVIERYASRNPYATPPDISVFVPSGENANRLFPSESIVLFPLSGASGKPTSACGLAIYRDNLLGEDVYGNSFTCEPVHQLVYRQTLRSEGNTYVGSRVDSERERDFLVSTDQWFRPVQAKTGPDGALWIVDMYRFVIEHPMWIPESVLSELDVFAGQRMGRIYRVVPKSGEAREIKDLSKLTSAELVRELDTPNGTVRDIVHQLLVWRQDVKEFDQLVSVFSQSDFPAVRVQVMYLLDQLHGLDEQLLLAALTDREPEVRRHALRLGETRFETQPEVYYQALRLQSDDELTVRTQLLYSLGQGKLADQQATNFNTMLALADSSEDAYLRGAFLSSIHQGNMLQLLGVILTRESIREWALDPLLAMIAKEGTQDQVNETLLAILEKDFDIPDWKIDALSKLLGHLDRRKECEHLACDEEVATRSAEIRSRLLQRAFDNGIDVSDRIALVRLVGKARGPFSQRILGGLSDHFFQQIRDLVSVSHSVELQLAAVSTVFELGDVTCIRSLLKQCRQTTPLIRRKIVEELISRPHFDALLVESLGEESLEGSDFDAEQRERLLQRVDPSLRQRLETAFVRRLDSDRNRLVEQWSDVTTKPGVPANGRGIFIQRCSQCHRLDEIGHAVGPDLAALTIRSSESLLRSILDPNREVDSRYISYVLVTEDGRSYSGQLQSETGTSVTLRQSEGKELSIARNQIERLNSTGQSLMPAGLEENLSKQDMADLISYLQQFGPPRKQFAGNEPRIIHQREGGKWLLSAGSAAIYGDQIAFESNSPFKNIGYWHSDKDVVTWTIDAPEATRVSVWIDYSCDPSAAGNVLQIDAGVATIRWQVEGTQGWSDYRRVSLGEIELIPGDNRISVRAASVLTTPALLDLRSISLVVPGVDEVLLQDAIREQ